MRKYLILTVWFVSLVPLLGCGKKDLQNKQQALEQKVSVLESKVAKLENLVKKPINENIPAKEVKKQEAKKTVEAKKAEQNLDDKNNKPTSFNFPEFKIEIKNFIIRIGTGNVAEYYGEVVNKGNKNINDLSLTTEFFDEFGNLIGGHSFPIKVIYANKERKFTNIDPIASGFKNIYKYNLKVKYVVYEGGQYQEGEEEKWTE
ncbi:MAG: hypothetical protein A2W05_06980 [Candidatus Schekmanbacteria bacterium RBG_16_38_10]|uniref:Uncharacterized protein n=1 Tax=Candidatus Schekmanbacteria bacterium RBG_16_38_10 TaxID=1817879 RepID=A0A1F7RYJ0_9BACT|nr:MAG: hypothetical protein A2W05_06980 [Candidatus Schekmanbacteria bacterium RBG_16_38_10]